MPHIDRSSVKVYYICCAISRLCGDLTAIKIANATKMAIALLLSVVRVSYSELVMIRWT